MKWLAFGVALRILRTTHGATPVSDFGPRKLKPLQSEMIDLGRSRAYVNANIHRIRRAFRWGVAEELVPAAVHEALKAVPGLRKGRTKARETKPFPTVAADVVDANLPHLPAVVAYMVTGCRPAEVCLVRPCARATWTRRTTCGSTVPSRTRRRTTAGSG